MNAYGGSAADFGREVTRDIEGYGSGALALEGEAGAVDAAIELSRKHLLDQQAEDGHWVFDLEADATIPAEYILLEHFLDDIDADVEAKLATYLREQQAEHGGWPLFHGGEFNLSASVKAYFALKLVGDDRDAPHMRRAREAILAEGGAACCNVFTRITLALFGQVPWRAVPTMPVEIMLLPSWSPFHLSKVSYWTRTVLVPLLILMAKKPQARNPCHVDIAELFVRPPFEEANYLVNPTGAMLGRLFLGLDHVVRTVSPHFPAAWQERAIAQAVEFIKTRLNGEDGLGGIFPAMANAVMALDTMGAPRDDPDYAAARRGLRKLLVLNGERGICQPCVSPVWDTALAMHSLLEAGEPETGEPIRRAVNWLVECQVTDVKGDWAQRRPNTPPGGWPFQFRNDYYPDTDDSAAAVMALARVGGPEAENAIRRGVTWILGMQSAAGGWGAFDADNTHFYLNHIPFADHGALLDPPTADVTARCVGMLAQCGYERSHPALARGIKALIGQQERDGSWFGRWGTNYIYGTWSALSALNAVGEDPASPHIRAAVAWLEARQLADGGWGEDCATYWAEQRDVVKDATPTQTAWAVLALTAAGEAKGEAVRRGVAYLLRTMQPDGSWEDAYYNAVGFPRVFYLKYHGYAQYFPLWALARYRRFQRGNRATTPYGL